MSNGWRGLVPWGLKSDGEICNNGRATVTGTWLGRLCVGSQKAWWTEGLASDQEFKFEVLSGEPNHLAWLVGMVRASSPIGLKFQLAAWLFPWTRGAISEGPACRPLRNGLLQPILRCVRAPEFGRSVIKSMAMWEEGCQGMGSSSSRP